MMFDGAVCCSVNMFAPLCITHIEPACNTALAQCSLHVPDDLHSTPHYLCDRFHPNPILVPSAKCALGNDERAPPLMQMCIHVFGEACESYFACAEEADGGSRSEPIVFTATSGLLQSSAASVAGTCGSSPALVAPAERR